LSKLSQLKQKAYQAGKSRNWALAIDCYEQIMELEKNNPSVVNELGDLCLKAGEVPRAVKHFLSAASRYRKTGLLNNSVAIYKKILRHDDGNLNAHWYLADIRAGQGITVEGQDHATRFLAGSEKMPGEFSEIFQKRFIKLFDLYPTSPVILERLAGIFRTRDMNLEAARAQLLLACCAFTDGKEDAARKMVDAVLAAMPQVQNYPEYNRWARTLDPDAAKVTQQADFNTVSFDEEPADDPVAAPAAPAAAAAPAPAPAPAPEAPAAAGPAEEDDCISIDVDGDASFSELIAAASAQAATQESGPAAPAGAAAEAKVDLLAQILSEEGGSLGDESTQLDTISAEIGSVVGGTDAGDDAGRLYEMGMVYLEMGMFDKACESFSVAACDEEFALRAHEMWGITLQRSSDPDGSIRVLTDGMAHAAPGSREHLTLRYHVARAHELAERAEAAQEIYRAICEVDEGFLDVKKRRDELAGVL